MELISRKYRQNVESDYLKQLRREKTITVILYVITFLSGMAFALILGGLR